MSPTTATSSPRDDYVDANPDLARKKQRLSEDHDEDSPAEDSVLIEACEPEDIGASLDTAIEIEDDENTMLPYSESFRLRRREAQPLEQLSGLAQEIMSGKYFFQGGQFQAVAAWLRQHCTASRDESSDLWREQYFDLDNEFFTWFGQLSLAALSTRDLFDPTDVNDPGMKTAVGDFLVNIAELSCRIISLLPQSLNSMLSRRDSALPGSAAVQHVDLFQFLGVAVRSLPQNSDMARGFSGFGTSDRKQIGTNNITVLSRPSVLEALGTIVKMLGGAMRQFKDSWGMLQDVLRLFSNILKLKQHETFPNCVLEEVMEVLKACILPAVCAKHPGALPEGFHNELIQFGQLAVLTLTGEKSQDEACQTYVRFVKSDEDAILHEGVSDDVLSQQLADVSGWDGAVQAQLLANSWAMQASIAYVRSDIMNVRSLGLGALTQQLQNAFEYAKKAGDLDHIYVQHAVRFLRKNEVSKYIFSSDSHASLISESSLIISFLSATATYTDQETDVIWRACSTSVEADFVKASFGVLANQLNNLDFGHVLYIFKKYGTTPIESIGAAATEFLPWVMLRLDQFHGPTFDQANRLGLAFCTVDILKHVEASKTGAISDKLRGLLHTAIAKFAGPKFTADDRREIYARVLPDVAKHASCGTTAAEVLTILIRSQPPPQEAETILAMLPASAAVDDLQDLVSSHKDQAENYDIINAVILRLSYVLCLMSLDKTTQRDNTIKKLFDSVFGEHALGEAARSAAWDKLHSLTVMKDSPAAALDLWRIYMQRYVPSLPTALASSRLVELIWAYLKEECTTDKIEADYPLLLQHPLWEALGRFATQSRDRHVIDSATSAVAYLLINYPAHPSTPDIRDDAVKCQQESVRQIVSALRTDYDQLCAQSNTTKEQDVRQAIDLLHALLLRSKEFDTYYAAANGHDVMVLESPVEENSQLSFTMQVYNAEPQPQVLSVQATKTTTVSQLLSSLPPKTGAAANRIIAAGREITGLTTQTLAEAGVQNAGVIQIRPRYKQDFDFDHLLRAAGPVEREIVAHFDSLESLMDGPTPIAESAVDFLRIIPPTKQARLRVASSSSLAEELFPRDRPARAQFSTYVLDWHIRDCARIGVADTQFLTRGARLLTSVLMDENRPLLEPLTPELLRCLHTFLQGKIEHGPQVPSVEITSVPERPSDDNIAPYFENGASLSARMMDRLFEIERAAHIDVATMRPTASSAYSTLLLATQIDSSAWEHFSASDRSSQLHARLLLFPDTAFSEGIAQPIRSLCQDSETPRYVSAFFWQALMTCLPEALVASTTSSVFFKLVPEVLHSTDTIHTNETSARSLVEQLSTVLCSYKHTESANDLLQDDAMNGLLRLLGDAVTIVRSFKKPLQLDGLSSSIAEKLLFPDDTDPQSQPIVHDDTRALAYDLLRLTLESTADFERIVNVTEQMTERSVRQAHSRFPGPLEWQRGPRECSGLTNLGMTCYMNSMLQQLYGNIPFRKFVLDLPMLYPEKQMLLREMQNLFAKMQNCTEPYQNTAQLAQVLGVQIGNQEDVHDFYASLLSRLEDEMPDSDSKAGLSQFFTGQSITQIRGECGHVSSQKEAFGDLSVTVKNKPNLYDSLAEFVQGEPMEGSNKYKCMSCDPENGRLVDAVRRTCLEDVPDCLTVCLKRFTYGSKFLGEGKVNDRFDFPETIDMSLYKRSHLEAPEQPHEPDVFQLVGVIVHQGSLNLGHYWSYVRVPNVIIPGAGDWFYLEDSKTCHCLTGFDVVQQECFGGQRYANGNERADNAYVLFYQRNQYSAEAPLACESAGSAPNITIGLPRIPLREPLASTMNESNRWRQRIAALFERHFATHVCWLLDQYPFFKGITAGASDSDSSPSLSDPSEDPPSTAHEAKVGELMAHYVLRILLSDPLCEDKLSRTISAYQAALTACPRLGKHVLEVFSADEFGFETVLLNDHPKVRKAVFDMLRSCISVLREQDQVAYSRATDRMLHVALYMRTNGWVDKNPLAWTEYFALLSFIANQGSEEARKVLDDGYVTWIIEVVWMSRFTDLKQKHQQLWSLVNHRDSIVDFDPLFQFLYNILSEQVDLSDLDPDTMDSEQRIETSRGWSLTSHERKWLTCLDDQGTHPLWMFYVLSKRRCRINQRTWKEYGLGQLLGLLVSDKADPTFKSSVVETLAYEYDKEEHDLVPLLYMTLHYCANNDDSECRMVVSLLSKTFHLWNADRKSLEFLSEAFTLAPRSVVDSTVSWADEFVRSSKGATRRATAEWLKTHIFIEQALSDDFSLDARRANVARALAGSLSTHVKHAYDREESKNRWESAMEVLQAIGTYISTLVSAVEQAQHADLELPTELSVECAEAKALLPRLGDLLAELESWESEVVLPTRNIRQSVEIDETDVSEDEDELEEFDELSQSL